MALSVEHRRLILTLYRYHYPGSPAKAARDLVSYGREMSLTERMTVIKGETLRSWATDTKAPLWAVCAAAYWLKEREVPLTTDEQAAMNAVMQIPAINNQ